MTKHQLAADRVFPVLQNNILVDGFHLVIDLERSEGVRMVDALEGKEYLDCYSYFASLPVGHNHPRMNEPEFVESLLWAAKSNPSNSDIYSREYAAFIETFRRLATPPEFRYLFFVAGGALAVENAMKAAFDWKIQRNRDGGVNGGGDKILHFREAFHGRSGYTLSVTNTELAKTQDFPQFDWPRISNPKIMFPVNEEAAAERETSALREMEAAFAKDPHGIAAILIEPIQGEGGDNHFRPEFLQSLREMADRHGALLIFDEVQTGMGLTGTMWAYQQFGVVPDLVCFGKKTQVCGIMSTTRIDSVKENVFHRSSRINSTWGGNLVDMVRCAQYLNIIHQEQLVERAAQVGSYFLEGLQDTAKDFAEMQNTRGRGLMLAFDLPDGARRDRVRTSLWEAGLATLPCGPRSIRFRPALTFGREHVDQALAILQSVLAGG